MNKADIVEKTKAYVRETLEGEGSGHDWWHIYRVHANAVHIGEEEGADMFVVELAALLHDIADYKFHGGDEEIGPRTAREWLEKAGADEETIAHVCQIIRDISFKGAGVQTPMKTKEGMVVQDADRLEAIGAIGIARTFAYGGHKNREIYNPEVAAVEHASSEEYKKNNSHTIAHFYEKLLLLKDRMNTAAAKKMAEGRHKFMEEYLDRFYKEWKGEA
ncbi:MAG TPA: HD domain-containing protein [Candidatus Paceibacterota bacterium]|nr:HD domain-containing protein [Candidatus Paceibacterota bacterium]